jgi:competence ComEA-like helix-hairpin-helix protein
MPSHVHGSASHAALGWVVALLSVAALAAQRAEHPSLPTRAPPSQPPAAAAAGVRALRDGQPMDLNRASAAELTLIPGVGPKLAERIVAERTRRGGFAELEELRAVRGIGPKTWERVRPFVEVRALRTGRASTTGSRPP